MSILLDIILLVVLVLTFTAGYKKGFVKSVWKIAALALTVVLVLILKDTAVNMLYSSNIANGISVKIAEKINIPQGGGVSIADTLRLPEAVKSEMANGIANATTSINEATVEYLTTLCVTVIACVALFVVIRLLLMAVYMIINGLSKAPLIKGVNKLTGGIFATVNAVFVVFLIFSLVSLFAPTGSGVFEVIDNTYIVKYLYNYNILLKLFMKI